MAEVDDELMLYRLLESRAIDARADGDVASADLIQAEADQLLLNIHRRSLKQIRARVGITIPVAQVSEEKLIK